MIAMNELSKLIPAAEALEVAKSAKSAQEESALARAINYAANTSDDGNIVLDWNQPISDDLIEKLKSYEYNVEHKKDAYGNMIQNFYIISCYSSGGEE